VDYLFWAMDKRSCVFIGFYAVPDVVGKGSAYAG
jgi:hypothetical protein